MLEWLEVIAAVAPLVAVLFYLDHKKAPRWQIWAVWIGYAAFWVGIGGGSKYHWQVIPTVVFIVLGAGCGAAGALAMEWPVFSRKPRGR